LFQPPFAALRLCVKNQRAKAGGVSHSEGVTQPLALIVYENLLPGSQLANRLQDLGYRVQPVPDIGRLVEIAEREKPLVVVTDLVSSKGDVCEWITRLHKNPATEHLPVLAFAAAENTQLQDAGRLAGAKIVASEIAMQQHLPQLLDQVLAVE
jgi:CheY-like chemotaxis protein